MAGVLAAHWGRAANTCVEDRNGRTDQAAVCYMGSANLRNKKYTENSHVDVGVLHHNLKES
jgi:hypothetical protein